MKTISGGMNISLLFLMLRIVAICLAIVGATLYLASYFIGLIFLAGALLVYSSGQIAAKGFRVWCADVKKYSARAAIPVVGIISALLLGGIIMLVTNYDPMASYKALFYGGFVRNWSISVLNATPLVFTGLAIAFAFKAGLFNIGAEGQYIIGVIVSTALGLRLNMPPLLAIPFIYMVSMCAGAALNLIPAVLKIKTGAHEVVTTMMFAYAVMTLSPMFIRANGGDPATTTHPYTTDQIKEAFNLPIFKDFLPNANYRLHIGILVAIACAFAVRFILDKTDLGFKVRAVGSNPLAAKTQGINVSRIIVISLLISGALASLAGVTQVLGLDHRMFQNLNAGYGWNGISIALLARNNPIAIIFTALLWGALDAGGQYMARTAQTPNAIIEILKSIILFLLLAEALYTRFASRIKKIFQARRLSHSASNDAPEGQTASYIDGGAI